MIPPLDFIPFAEETGLIVPIGRWTLSEACRTAAAWSAPNGVALTIAVNVSVIWFRHPDFVTEVTRTLEETGIDPPRLTLEITESVLVQDSELMVGRLSELKRLGVQLAIDDFGTGYSSLSYLRDFPIDVLKIDKTFIDSLSRRDEESALARAVIRLGQTLGLKVVAEGVEYAEQGESLQALGCPLAQGFLYSRPVDAEALDLLLANGSIPLAGAPTVEVV